MLPYGNLIGSEEHHEDIGEVQDEPGRLQANLIAPMNLHAHLVFTVKKLRPFLRYISEQAVLPVFLMRVFVSGQAHEIALASHVPLRLVPQLPEGIEPFPHNAVQGYQQNHVGDDCRHIDLEQIIAVYDNVWNRSQIRYHALQQPHDSLQGFRADCEDVPIGLMRFVIVPADAAQLVVHSMFKIPLHIQRQPVGHAVLCHPDKPEHDCGGGKERNPDTYFRQFRLLKQDAVSA